MPSTKGVIIVGAGPAGLFAALALARAGEKNILLLEKGKDIHERRCLLKGNRPTCFHCQPCSVVCGVGGAGAFSDGKLTLTADFGGFLHEILGRRALEELIDYVDHIYQEFGATSEFFGGEQQAVHDLQRQAATADLTLLPARIRHLGTEKCLEIVARLRNYLQDKVEIRTNTPVERLLCHEGGVLGVRTCAGEEILADYVICGPGREGSEWFAGEAERLGLSAADNPVDIGVRVEVPAVVLEHITQKIYESKLIYYSRSFDDRVRTFCMNPYGEVVMENNGGLITVNGHSYAEKKTGNTNFALLVSKSFTEPFKEPIRYGRNVAQLANMLGGGALVQRLGDLLAGRRSTRERIDRGLVRPTLEEATPGDLSLVLPYRHLLSILEMLEALDKVAPGVNSRHTLLYGVEVKFYSSRLAVNHSLETKVQNLFAVGDGAGVTRGLAQASAAGIVAAREILRRQAEQKNKG
ncbi:MAG: NAD(P)/FAD-dependent oxidoreductase [Dethiobacter sp.]|nr:NAD(P)/FAD-dependent oxidoreductase [Dethiobacter sp.]